LSVYKHHNKPDWWTIKISNGRGKPADSISYKGTLDEAKACEAEIRGTVDRTDPGWGDLLTELRLAYRFCIRQQRHFPAGHHCTL